MPIRLAQTAEDELDALQQATLTAARVRGRKWFISENWEICGHRVRFYIVQRNTKCGVGRWTGWMCDGRRIGYNALMGKLRKAGG